jgi:hypothetical protein
MVVYSSQGTQRSRVSRSILFGWRARSFGRLVHACNVPGLTTHSKDTQESRDARSYLPGWRASLRTTRPRLFRSGSTRPRASSALYNHFSNRFPLFVTRNNSHEIDSYCANPLRLKDSNLLRLVFCAATVGNPVGDQNYIQVQSSSASAPSVVKCIRHTCMLSMA